MRFTALLLLTLISILRTQTASIVMKAAVGETITVECPQATQQKHHVIRWCKATSNNYCNRISSIDGDRVWNGDARTSIANTNGKISVTIQQLQETDTGTYWCGPPEQNSIHASDVIILKVLSVLRTQTASIVMKAAVGETITVECPQATQQKHQEIWWCKETSKNCCNLISSISGDRGWNVDARTSIANTNGSISVTIQQLKETDTGTYWCGPLYEIHISDVVILKVFSGRWEPILSEVSGVVGNAATIPCLFTDKERLYKKFLCKATSVNKCIIIARSDGVPENRINGKVSNTINNSHSFTVTMTNTDKGDEGEYWCGAEKINDIKIVAMKNLTITEVLRTQTASIVMKAAVGETITVECPQATQYKHFEIWWCKKTSETRCNQISSTDGDRVWNDDARTSIANTHGNISVTIQRLEETDTGTYWCGPLYQNTLHALDVVILKVFSVLWTQTASIVMKAAVGETITVECPQATQHKHREIWWCKKTSEIRCNQISSIDGDRVWNDDARTSIANTNGNIALTIHRLEETDTGIYWCGPLYQNTLRALDVVILKVFSGRWEPILSEVSGVVGNAAIIPCLFTEKERLYQKFLCKATSVNKCIIIASSNGVPENRNNGNVSITIDNSYNFIVTMNNIDKGNEGEYWCGAEKINDIKIVAIRNLTITEVLRTQTASIVMKAAVGETITVECPQATQYKHFEIWWCKKTSETRCNQISSIDGDRVWNVDARTSIANTHGNISVTIQRLEETDTGTYWCGPLYQNTLHALDVVILKVFSGRWEPILSEVSGVVGNAAIIPCLFTEKERLYQKFLCKATSVNKCIIIASSNGVPENRNNGNVSITIDNSYNFIVTMNNIDKGNEGEYWCGAEKINDIKIVAIRNLTITEVGNSEVSNNTSRDVLLEIWAIFRWLLFSALVACTVSVTCYADCAKDPAPQVSK
ncbi:polymeric immunoglobulin receptor-like [Mustelus asterias]